jgi:hypothetical protein
MDIDKHLLCVKYRKDLSFIQNKFCRKRFKGIGLGYENKTRNMAITRNQVFNYHHCLIVIGILIHSPYKITALKQKQLLKINIQFEALKYS